VNSKSCAGSSEILAAHPTPRRPAREAIAQPVPTWRKPAVSSHATRNPTTRRKTRSPLDEPPEVQRAQEAEEELAARSSPRWPKCSTSQGAPEALPAGRGGTAPPRSLEKKDWPRGLRSSLANTVGRNKGWPDETAASVRAAQGGTGLSPASSAGQPRRWTRLPRVFRNARQGPENAGRHGRPAPEKPPARKPRSFNAFLQDRQCLRRSA